MKGVEGDVSILPSVLRETGADLSLSHPFYAVPLNDSHRLQRSVCCIRAPSVERKRFTGWVC